MFSNKQINKAKFILENRHSNFEELQDFEIKDLAVVWSYYSGKIEGNTYTYNTFMFVVETIKEKLELEITPFNIKALHSELTYELVENKDRGKLRNK